MSVSKPRLRKIRVTSATATESPSIKAVTSSETVMRRTPSTLPDQQVSLEAPVALGLPHQVDYILDPQRLDCVHRFNRRQNARQEFIVVGLGFAKDEGAFGKQGSEILRMKLNISGG
jgi:hypothetical protein